MGAFLLTPMAALIRNVAIARLLGVDMYGLAVTLIITATFFDIIIDTGSDKYLVQHSEGDTQAVLDTAHAVMAFRGLLAAALIALCSWPLSLFYRQPQIAPALAMLGVVPLITALRHLDIRRLQRERDFRAESRVMIVSEIAAMLIAVVSAYYLRNFYAALWTLIGRAIVMAVMSHVVAKHPYRFRYDAAIGRDMLRFGWPLMLNGGLVFLGGQGDRIVVGHLLDVRALGLYSTTLLLIFYPTSILQRFLSGIYFPEIAASRDTPQLDLWEARLRGQLMLAAVLGAIGFTIVAPFVLVHVYGRSFAQEPVLVGLIGMLQVVRMLRVWPATMAIGLGRTGNILVGNLLRLAALPLAAAGVALGYGLAGLVVGFLLGELIAIAGAQLLLSRTRARPIFSGFGSILIMVGTAMLVTLIGRLLGGADRMADFLLTALAAGFVLLVCVTDRSIFAAFTDIVRIARKKLEPAG